MVVGSNFEKNGHGVTPPLSFLWYSYPELLLFLDETSKDGRHAFRRHAWSERNTKAVVRLPFSRGKRVSVLAVADCHGFVGWKTAPGAFTRGSFHESFVIFSFRY